MAIETGRQLGTHEILSALGRGGMGEVWRARDSKLGREVAIKTLPPEFAGDQDRLARFEREARVLASLNHPNIAAIYGLEESGGTRFLVLELVEGDTLADVVRRGAVPAEEAVNLALQIAAALEAAHEKGVVHRDLKPANIKITPDGKVKVLDFGLAKALQIEEQDLSNSPTLSTAATARGIILGTAAYMSPEQARGTHVDGRSDVWAFGCVLYEMLTGRPVFRGDMVSDILASVIARDPDFAQLPAQLHPRFREIVQRCLEKDAKRRWQAIGDVRLELERLLASGITAPRESEAVARTTKRLVLPLVVTSALVAAAAVWFLKPVPPPDPRPLMRFDYEVPATYNLRGPGRPVLAFSPDGRHFVYNTNLGIVLRSMDSLTARIIPGTEEVGITNPFFSPDGEWLGYFSTQAGSIRKISIAGGAPVTIAPATNPYSATWGKDDTILFAQNGQGIMRVSADGGTPELVIKTEMDEVAYGPSMLPDGKTVLYSLTRAVGQTRWDQAEIVAQEVKTSKRKVLLKGGSDARYVPTGHLVYAVGNVLFAVAFDLNALAVKGGAVPLVQGVQRATQPATNTATANFGLSDRGTLVYLNAVAGGDTPQTTVGIVDLKGVVRQLNVPPAVYRSPRVSPDGRSIAVETIAENGQSIIWIYDLSGKTAIRRLTNEGSNTRPVWTRDSRRIVYGSDRDKSHGLYLQLADGTGLAERLTTAAEGMMHFPESFSPDGKVLSFAIVRSSLGQNSWGLWTLNMDAGEKKPVLFYDVPEANDFGANFSPDGKWIAYASNNAHEANQIFGIYVQPYPPTGTRYEISRNGGAWPVWHPQGNELFYRLNVGQANAARIKAVAITTNPVPTFTSDMDLPIQGFALATNYREYDIMPSGKEFVMVFPVAQTPAPPPARPHINIVLNWFTELQQRVPVK
jgi:Protein kinase domain/WD40-like Beta Propeller Repeat